MNVVINGNKGILEPAEQESKGVVLILHGKNNNHNSPIIKEVSKQFPNHWRLRADFKFKKTNNISEGLTNEIKEAKEMLAFLLRRANCPASKCIIVGKSLGAFIASKLATQYAIKGVALLGYPLHEKNQPTAWFPQEHFRKIKKPILLLVGDKDILCNLSMARALKAKVNKIDLVVVEKADHSFRPLNSDKKQSDNEKYVSEIIKAWEESL